jgi:hypothetical protein
MNHLLTWIPVFFAGLPFLQDTLPTTGHTGSALWVNQRTLHIKDTFSFRWDGQPIGKAYPTATLHVWADHLESGRRWKFRYPILNGMAEGDLALGKTLPPGMYAVNFMASDQFFDVSGRVKKVRIKTAMNHETRKRDTIAVYEYPRLMGGELTYYLLGREGILHSEKLVLDDEGRFNLPPIVFGDSAQLIFDPKKGKGTYWIDIETPLDSSFTPFFTETVFMQLDDPAQKPEDIRVVDTSEYSFEFSDPRFTDMLPEVKVSGKSNAQKFEDEYVTGMFRNSFDVKTFEGLDSDLIFRMNNIFLFLQSHVPGLMYKGNFLNPSFSWRGSPVSFYLNEMFVRSSDIAMVAPMDVALIKAYPPPAMVSGAGSGGAIAIYTKRGAYEKDPSKPRYHFMVRGYTQGESRWGE